MLQIPTGIESISRWFLDGIPEVTGTSFVYTPSSADIGIHLVRVNASDNNLLGGTSSNDWITIATLQLIMMLTAGILM